jgi:DMSO/TMAO reductase YedYZ molybdopterin-dependent catalytic subunit
MTSLEQIFHLRRIKPMAFWNPQQRVDRLRAATPRRRADKDPLNRIPPGQYTTTKFPVLTYGETPRISLKDWRLKVWGLVENPVELTWEMFLEKRQMAERAGVHS